MKKVIIVFDGSSLPKGALDFAARLNELQPLLLTGVFLPQQHLATHGEITNGEVLLDEEGANEEQLRSLVEQFGKICHSNGIEYRVHERGTAMDIADLEQESLFADLIIASSGLFFEDMEMNVPSSHLEHVLRHTCCPVLLVPEKFEFPESIVLAYDGSEDSVFAIKQFAYLFPELVNKETIIVYANMDEGADFPYKVQIEELVVRHFVHLTLTKIEIDPQNYFNTWVASKKSPILVSGSYGRSGLSKLFRKSFARDIIADHWMPVFIAHK